MFARITKSIIGPRQIAAGLMIGLALYASLMAIPRSVTAAERQIGVTIDELTWLPFAQGTAQMAVLWQDAKNGEYAMLLKLPAGWTPGAHSHSADYHGVTLQGTWLHTFGDDDSRSLPPGSYVLQPGEQVHDDACAGPAECILLIHQHKPFDYTPATAAAD